MIEKINYSGEYGFIENLTRFFSSDYKNKQDSATANLVLRHLEELAQTQKGEVLTPELETELANTKKLLTRLKQQWFVSKEVRDSAKKLSGYVTAERISKDLHIPFKTLAENEELRKIIVANHLHHKITKQHQAIDCRIKETDNGSLLFPVATKQENPKNTLDSHVAITEYVTLEELKKRFEVKPNGKIKDVEFMANGLEVHPAKKWEDLRPSYRLEVEDGYYVHIDTLTGNKEIIGKEGENHVQLINVQPWGWNPKGGALFGHTWIRFVIDGQLYHVGGNLQGDILNPDFMAALSMKNKSVQTSKWAAMKEDRDKHGNSQAERVLIKLEGLQAHLTNHLLPEKAIPYAKVVEEIYNELRNKEGGTCTSAATRFIKEFGLDELSDLESEGKDRITKVVFNSFTTRILDAVWGILPKSVRRTLIQPFQIFTRGKKPIFLRTNSGGESGSCELKKKA